MSIPPRRYTIADLEQLPDDGSRYELLDGQLLVTPQAKVSHQLIASRLGFMLAGFLGDDGPAFVVGPGEVQQGNDTHLEPDVLVLPREHIRLTDQEPVLHWKHFRGHWLAVEIVGRHSRGTDRGIKRQAYHDLGIEEVWIVDHREQLIERSKWGSSKMEFLRTSLVWRPLGMPRELMIDLPRLFRAPQ